MAFTFKTLLFLLMCVSIIPTYGQNDGESKPRPVPPKRLISEVEFLIGPSVIYFHGEDFYDGLNVLDFDNASNALKILKIGYSLNLALTHKFTSRFESTVKFGYENRGSKTISYSLNTDYNPPAIQKGITDITLNYVTATLLPNYSITKNKRLFIGCGPYFGYLASTRVYQETYMLGALVSRSGGRPDPSWDNKMFDFGLAVMIGYSFPVKQKQSGSIQFFYNRGLKDINQPMITPIRNTSITVLFGIKIK